MLAPKNSLAQAVQMEPRRIFSDPTRTDALLISGKRKGTRHEKH
jgi:hypothetical protein